MVNHSITITANADADIDTVELQCGGRIIFPQVRLTMTAGKKKYDLTNTVVEEGMKSIRKHIQTPSQ